MRYPEACNVSVTPKLARYGLAERPTTATVFAVARISVMAASSGVVAIRKTSQRWCGLELDFARNLGRDFADDPPLRCGAPLPCGADPGFSSSRRGRHTRRILAVGTAGFGCASA